MVGLGIGVAVHVGVVLGGFFRVMLGVKSVAVGYVSMMPGFFVIAGFMMFGRGAMMARSMFVMFCCLTMVFSALFGHGEPFVEIRYEEPVDLGSE